MENHSKALRRLGKLLIEAVFYAIFWSRFTVRPMVKVDVFGESSTGEIAL
jgi:hypothetical protein